MGLTQHRVTPWVEVMGPDGEKIFAVGDKVRKYVTANAAAGTNTVAGDTVPAGEIWVIQAVVCFDNTSAIASIHSHVYDGAATYFLNNVKSPAAGQALVFNGNVPIFPGDAVRASYFGCVAGDTLYLTYIGYKMTIP